MHRLFYSALVFFLAVASSGPLKATNILMENNTEGTSFRVRVDRGDDGSSVLYESVPPGVWIGVDDSNVQAQDSYEFYTYDVTDILEENVLVYSIVWGNEAILATNAGGQLVHVSLTTGMEETSVGRVILTNTTNIDAAWNNNTVLAYTTNAFEVPSAAYTLAVWSPQTRPWGWLPSVRLLQPEFWTNFSPLSDDEKMMLFVHDHDPEHWVEWTWNGLQQVWVFGSVGVPGEGSGVGGGGSGGGGSGGGGSGGGGGGTGGGGATGTGTITGGTITINLNGVALESTQLRNENLLEQIRLNSVTNNLLVDSSLNHLATIEALLTTNAPTPSELATIQTTAETAAENGRVVAEAEATGVRGVFSRMVNVTAISASVPHSLFVIDWTIAGNQYEVNYDPRDNSNLALVLDLFKMLVCLLVFYLAVTAMWRWYDKKMGEMSATNNTGTAGEAILGTNANLATSAINATIIVGVIGVTSILMVGFLVSTLTASAVGMYFSQTGLLDGTHSAYSNDAIMRAMVFVEMVLPVNCIIAACFVVMLVEVVGHYVWLGASWVIRYANA